MLVGDFTFAMESARLLPLEGEFALCAEDIIPASFLRKLRLTVQSISAITLAVHDMSRSVVFYRDRVGLAMLYGGEGSGFTSFRVGVGYLNLISTDKPLAWWGRSIFYVDDVDEMYSKLVDAGVSADTEPTDAPWGERYFHVTDPDGHELSFAKPIDSAGH